MKQQEHILQRQCVAWFDLQYPSIRHLLFAIPNGGHRHRAVAGKLKAEGVRAGVPDLFLSLPSNSYSGFYIEMKTETGRMSKPQKTFMTDVIDLGYCYEVIRDFEQFQKAVRHYLQYTTP